MTPPRRPRHALIVAHGSPSAPEGPEAVFARLAAEAEALLPGWRVGSATLAAPGALDRACAALPGDAETLLLPFFMTDGWFVSDELPRRVEAAGGGRTRILPPFGMAAEIAALCARRAREAAAAAGLDPARAALIVAAHGSPSDPRPARATEALAESLRASSGFADVRTGYVDEEPALVDALKADGRRSACRSSSASRVMWRPTCQKRSKRRASPARSCLRSAPTPRRRR